MTKQPKIKMQVRCAAAVVNHRIGAKTTMNSKTWQEDHDMSDMRETEGE